MKTLQLNSINSFGMTLRTFYINSIICSQMKKNLVTQKKQAIIKLIEKWVRIKDM